MEKNFDEVFWTMSWNGQKYFTGQKFSGQGSTSVDKCTDDLVGIHTTASAPDNLIMFGESIAKYREGIVVTSGKIYEQNLLKFDSLLTCEHTDIVDFFKI
jgi:hypothetical protein